MSRPLPVVFVAIVAFVALCSGTIVAGLAAEADIVPWGTQDSILIILRVAFAVSLLPVWVYALIHALLAAGNR